MDITIDELPYIIYVHFVLHNLCEFNNESVSEESVRSAIVYNRDFQPASQENRRETNESGGKKVRWILTKYFNP